jgi:hypothetical protein
MLMLKCDAKDCTSAVPTRGPSGGCFNHQHGKTPPGWHTVEIEEPYTPPEPTIGGLARAFMDYAGVVGAALQADPDLAAFAATPEGRTIIQKAMAALQSAMEKEPPAPLRSRIYNIGATRTRRAHLCEKHALPVIEPGEVVDAEFENVIADAYPSFHPSYPGTWRGDGGIHTRPFHDVNGPIVDKPALD